MSRIGKKSIEIPSGVAVNLSGNIVSVKGPKGELKREIFPSVNIKISDKDVLVETKSPDNSALWGTFASHIINMLEGVSKGFEKKLQIEGIGYKGEVKGNSLVFALGFSHPVNVSIPEGLKATIEKNLITISGIDKEAVGAFAAKLRDNKKPEPYKGKGIRYEGEVVDMKQGKKSV